MSLWLAGWVRAGSAAVGTEHCSFSVRGTLRNRGARPWIFQILAPTFESDTLSSCESTQVLAIIECLYLWLYLFVVQDHNQNLNEVLSANLLVELQWTLVHAHIKQAQREEHDLGLIGEDALSNLECCRLAT